MCGVARVFRAKRVTFSTWGAKGNPAEAKHKENTMQPSWKEDLIALLLLAAGVLMCVASDLLMTVREAR